MHSSHLCQIAVRCKADAQTDRSHALLVFGIRHHLSYKPLLAHQATHTASLPQQLRKTRIPM